MLRAAEIDSNETVVKCETHNLPKPCIICSPLDDSSTFRLVTNSLTAQYHELWRELHNAVDPTPEWLAGWRARLPKTCDCEQGLSNILATLPPTFGDGWFRWTFHLRNCIREKLGKPFFSWCDALAQWRPHLRWAYKQPRIEHCIAVTSLAPHRLERQTAVLNSWQKFGLDIVSVNTHAECERIQSDYPQVSTWLHSESDCQTQRINALLDVSIERNIPILLINADIEIWGDQLRLTDLVASRRNAIGVRHNYETQPGAAAIEQWGLDAFLVYPEQVRRLSRVKFSIGKPMWDYWLPWELEQMGECSWITEPYFFHRAHAVAWTQEECSAAHEAFALQFGQMDWTEWRSSRPGR